MQDIENIELNYLSLDDYQELKEAMIEAYSSMPDSFWRKQEIKNLLNKFPEGQVVIKVNQQIAGCAFSIIVDEDKTDAQHTYDEITGNSKFTTHNPDGDVLYGVEVFIKPEFRGMRLGRRLYDYRKELCEKLNLKSVAFGGRIPNYHNYADELTPKEYIEKVRLKEIDDPVLNFQMSNDFHPKRVLKNYLEGDNLSNEYAVLLEWDNIYYTKPSKEPTITKKVVRLGLIQWQMRSYATWKSLCNKPSFLSILCPDTVRILPCSQNILTLP